MDTALRLFFVFVLVLLNGYFVASEFALVAVRKTRIKELALKGRKRAKLVHHALEDIDTIISATQLGITIASMALGWIGEPIVAHIIEPFLQFIPANAANITSHGVAFLIAFVIITFLHIVFGEIAPKTVALERSESTALLIIIPLIAFTKIFKPFISALNKSANFVLDLLRLPAPGRHQLVHSVEEIKMILEESAQKGAIESTEAEMLTKVFRFGQIPVKRIMTPRSEIISIDVNNSLTNIVSMAKKHPHSRFPVYKKSVHNITGFVHIKDIFTEIFAKDGKVKISETNIIRDNISVSENKRIDEILLLMRRKRVHIAVVKNKSNKTVGIVTLEDILESLVGEIEDEFE